MVREGTKQALIIAMLGRPEGASIAEIAESTGWLHHTIRGMIAGLIRKKLSLAISSGKGDERGPVYRLARTTSGK
jgi:DNA-binding MarR family transcriptional regulator